MAKHGPVWRSFFHPLYAPSLAFAFPVLLGIVLAAILTPFGGWRGALLGMALATSLEIPIALRTLYVRLLTGKRNARDEDSGGPEYDSLGMTVRESPLSEFIIDVPLSRKKGLSYRAFALRCAILSGAIALALNLILAFTVMGLLYLAVGVVVAFATGPLLYLVLWLFWKLFGEELAAKGYRW